MNDLVRPALYQAYHEVVPVVEGGDTVFGDIVGPICESGDFLAAERDLPACQPGDLLALRGAGAYAFSMASTYNSRGRAAEVMVDGSRHALVRQRETVEDLVRGEQVPSWE
jgi:diaminopimelate decarboxylase